MKNLCDVKKYKGYLYLNRKVTEKKLEDYKKIITFLNSKKIEYLIYFENKDNPLVKELIYKKNNKPKKNHLIYDVIIIKNNSFDYFDNDNAYSLYWIYNLKDSLKIKLVSSFDNLRVFNIMKELERNDLCAFDRFTKDITKKDIEDLRRLENILKSYNIEYHYITLDELYDEGYIRDDGVMFFDVYNKYKKENFLFNIYGFSNDSLVKLGFKKGISYHTYPYTFCKIIKVKNYGLSLGNSCGQVAHGDFFEFIYKINRELNGYY